MLDVTLLQLLKYRQRYERYFSHTPSRAIDPAAFQVLAQFGKFFADCPDVQCVRPGPFMAWVLLKHPKMQGERLAKIESIVRLSEKDAEAGLEAGLLRRLAEAAMAADLQTAALKFADGEEIDLRATIDALSVEYDHSVGAVQDDPCLADTIEELLEETEDDAGIHFRLNCLNQCMRPLRAGDFGLLAARPDRGKGTFIASEVTHWAPQIVREFGPGRPIVVAVNEGPGRRFWERLYCAALGVDVSGLIDLKRKGTLRQAYAEALGGDAGIIRVVEIHGKSSDHITNMVRKLQPSVLWLDMLANIRLSQGPISGGTRSDQIVEATAQWARELCVLHDMIGLATVQLSAEAEGIPYPPMSAMKDSKTGLQGANDFIIFSGASNDPTLGGSRFISAPKNKLRRVGAPASPHAEVIFDALQARYKD